MKTVLIPVDFSETSRKALEVASIIAKRIDAKIVLTHMAGIENNLNKEPNSFEEALYYSKLIGKKFREFIQTPSLDGIIIEPILQKHIDFTSISEMAEDIHANLIVMGAHESYGISEYFAVSNANKVVRSSEIPVLVIKNNDLNFIPERILFASDFNLETLSAYHRIIEVAMMLNAHIEFLYINTPGKTF